MKTDETQILLDTYKTKLIIKRFALQLLENHESMENTAIIGLQPRGVELASAIVSELHNKGIKNVLFGVLDHTFFRDDIGRGEIHLPKPSNINFSTENKNIIIVDDVLYTGRSIRSAMDAIMSFGRPKRIELMVLVERIFEREIPIKPDYKGISIDSRNSTNYVRVDWNSTNEVTVWLLDKKIENK